MKIGGSKNSHSPRSRETTLLVNDAPESRATVEPTGVSGQILLVDDDADAHFLLKRQIAKLGLPLSFMTALDGDEAVDYLEKAEAAGGVLPFLVFLDVKMPGMGGFEVLDWMRERELLGRMSVVMLSSSDDPRDVSRAMSLGAHSYLTKPPRLEVLQDLIAKSLRLRARKPVAHARSGSRVLIVDDSTFARRTSRQILELMGYDVLEAHDGPRALELVASRAPDIVFLDLVMSGGLSGFDVLAQLRGLAPQVHVVIATADTQDVTAQRALASGANAIVSKPLNADKVAAVMPK